MELTSSKIQIPFKELVIIITKWKTTWEKISISDFHLLFFLSNYITPIQHKYIYFFVHGILIRLLKSFPNLFVLNFKCISWISLLLFLFHCAFTCCIVHFISCQLHASGGEKKVCHYFSHSPTRVSFFLLWIIKKMKKKKFNAFSFLPWTIKKIRKWKFFFLLLILCEFIVTKN